MPQHIVQVPQELLPEPVVVAQGDTTAILVV
jgi:hypothetical protein